MTGTAFAEFMQHAPRIVMRDDLARFLGAVEGGVIEYRYEDAVRLAGHSCPTVASAFLMARRALARLFGEDLPERGRIGVDCRDPRDAGVTGVVASVFTLVTGAAEDGGFQGIGGHFRRRGLLRFGQPIAGEVRITRLDTGEAVDARAHPQRVPADPRLRALLPACLSGQADAASVALFGELWQERVAKLLLEHADDPEVIELGDPLPAHAHR